MNQGDGRFKDLLEGASIWRRSAELIKQEHIDIRQWHRREVRGTEEQNRIVGKLLLIGRHLFTMAHNRMVSFPIFDVMTGERHPAQLYERLLFTHYAWCYRGYLADLIHEDGQELLPLKNATDGGAIL